MITHGTRTGYKNHGCRCGPCVEANREYKRAWYAANPRPPKPPRPRKPLMPCGTTAAYARGCRCEACFEAAREGRGSVRRNGVPTCGTLSMYEKGCRCALCGAAKSAYSRAYAAVNRDRLREQRRERAGRHPEFTQLRKRQRVRKYQALTKTEASALPWSVAETVALLSLKEQGYRNVEIACALGRSFKSVERKIAQVNRSRT